MPTLKAKELRSLTAGELTEKIDGLRKELFQTRLQAKVGKIEDLTKQLKIRRDLARYMTVRNELEKKNG